LQQYKKTISFIMLTLAVLPMVMVLLLPISRFFIRDEVKEKQEEEQLIAAQLQLSQIFWLKEYKLFDAESIQQQGNRHLMIARLFNNEEQQLPVQLGTWLNDKNNKNHHWFLIDSFSSQSTLPERFVEIEPINIHKTVCPFHHSYSRLIFSNTDVPTPPPLL